VQIIRGIVFLANATPANCDFLREMHKNRHKEALREHQFIYIYLATTGFTLFCAVLSVNSIRLRGVFEHFQFAFLRGSHPLSLPMQLPI
jgi:hypothetical protein